MAQEAILDCEETLVQEDLWDRLVTLDLLEHRALEVNLAHPELLGCPALKDRQEILDYADYRAN